MARSLIKCAYCGTDVEKENGAINRARKQDKPIYCGRMCFGLDHKGFKTGEQKRKEKREYDKQYRKENIVLLKAKKAEYFKQTYDPEKARIDRKKRAGYHAEYCRQPEYRKWKKEYDREYRAKKLFGEYWECYLLTLDIREECLEQASDYDIRKANETINKAQQRKRNEHINRY